MYFVSNNNSIYEPIIKLNSLIGYHKQDTNTNSLTCVKRALIRFVLQVLFEATVIRTLNILKYFTLESVRVK